MFVTWTELALDQLAAFYVALSLADQDTVARTVQRINAELSIHPDTLGESREGNTRIWFEGRLSVRYLLRPADGVVTVYSVSLLRGLHR